MSSLWTVERLLTSPNGFGLVTASPLQRACCRIIDGLPLGELAECQEVRTAVGDVDALPVGAPPAEVVLLGAVRSAKSMMAAAAAVRATQTCDVSALRPGEIPRVPIVSIKMDLGEVIRAHIVGMLGAQPMLGALLRGKPTSDTIVLRHPSGRPIEITLVPLDRAAGSLVGRWLASVIFDEAPRMIGAADGVRNLTDARTASIGRLLPGAQILDVGSPWAPFGPIYKLVREHWGKPSERIVVIRGIGPAMNPSWWTPERCEKLRRSDPTAYRTDVLGEFAEPESALFSVTELDACTREGALELEPAPGRRYTAAIDPATRGNSWPLVIGHSERLEGGRRRFVIDLARQWTGRRGAPLSPGAVLGEIAEVCGPYGVRVLHTDQFAADALRDLARPHGLSLRDVAITSERKLDMYEDLRTFAGAGQLELPPHDDVRADLMSVTKRVTQTGLTIQLPSTSDGRHADYAAAVALCVRSMARMAGMGGKSGGNRDIAAQLGTTDGTLDIDERRGVVRWGRGDTGRSFGGF